MTLAFYRAEHGSLIDKIIDWTTGNRGFCHVELVFSDGRSFSSRAGEGVGFKDINYDSQKEAGKWKIITFDVTPEQEAIMMAFAKSKVGKKYDYLGAIGVVLHNPDDPGHYFCSEIVSLTLMKANVLPPLVASSISPNKLEMLAEQLLVKKPVGR